MKGALKTRTIEEVLNCVNYCMFSKGCTKENYDCCYGDKGLSDCDVRLENDYKKIMAEVKKINTFERLEEICDAERDGRLVVLPCKKGDTVYVYNLDVCDWVMSPKVLTFVLCQSGWFVTLDMGSTDKHPDGEVWYMKLSDFGKTVFLTREEAEKALKGALKNDTKR